MCLGFEHLTRTSAGLAASARDHDRARRCGFPEVVFCQGKTPAQVDAIAVEILSRADRVLLTYRATATDAIRSKRREVNSR